MITHNLIYKSKSMNNNSSLLGLLFVLLSFVLQVHAAVVASLSSYLTLVQTNYVLNLTFTSVSIPASSVPTLSLSSRFLVDSATISNCQFTTSSASAYASTVCTPSSNSTTVTVTFPNVYPSAASAQTLLSLKVSSFAILSSP